MDDAERDYFINNPNVGETPFRGKKGGRKECPICGHKVKEHYKKSSVFGTKIICDICGCKTKHKEFFAILDSLYPTKAMINNCGECGHKKKAHSIKLSDWGLTKIVCNACSPSFVYQKCKIDLAPSPSCRNALDILRQIGDLNDQVRHDNLKNYRFSVLWDGVKIITNPDGRRWKFIYRDEAGRPCNEDGRLI